MMKSQDRMVTTISKVVQVMMSLKAVMPGMIVRYGGEGENVLDGGDGDDRIYGHQGGTDEIQWRCRQMITFTWKATTAVDGGRR